MLLLGKRKNPLILTIIALLGLFLTETSDLLASDAENKIGKYQRFTAYKDITRFEGEILYNNISFLWFDNETSIKVQFFLRKRKLPLNLRS